MVPQSFMSVGLLPFGETNSHQICSTTAILNKRIMTVMICVSVEAEKKIGTASHDCYKEEKEVLQ